MSHYILQSERSNIQTIPMCNPCTTMSITQQTTIFTTSMVALTTSMEVSKSLYIKCHWPRWNFWGRIPFRNRWHGNRTTSKTTSSQSGSTQQNGDAPIGSLTYFLTPTKTGRGLPNSWQVYKVVRPTSMFCVFFRDLDREGARVSASFIKMVCPQVQLWKMRWMMLCSNVFDNMPWVQSKVSFFLLWGSSHGKGYSWALILVEAFKICHFKFKVFFSRLCWMSWVWLDVSAVLEWFWFLNVLFLNVLVVWWMLLCSLCCWTGSFFLFDLFECVRSFGLILYIYSVRFFWCFWIGWIVWSVLECFTSEMPHVYPRLEWKWNCRGIALKRQETAMVLGVERPQWKEWKGMTLNASEWKHVCLI